VSQKKTSKTSPLKFPFLARLRAALNGESKQLQAQKARLEAFLAAVPGEYCGFARDGSVAFSPGFCDMLGLEKIEQISDVQNRLSPGDAAALEGMVNRMRQNNTGFTMSAKSHDDQKTYKIAGSRGYDCDESDRFNVLWIEDITEEVQATRRFTENTNKKEERLLRMEESLNSIHRPVWIRDEQQKLAWVNKAYEKSLGQSAETILNEQKELTSTSRKKKTLPDEKYTPGQGMAKTAFDTNEVLSARAHIIVDGQRLLMNISEIPMPNLQSTLGMALNITREEDLETTLQRYQTSNKELLEQLQTAIAIYQDDKSLEFYNSAFAQLWGLEDGWLNTHPTLGDIMEKLRETRRLPEQADFRRFKQSWTDMFTGLIDPHEDMLHLPDGSTIRMLVIPHSMGGLMMTFEDVTSRLELESSYNTLIAVQQETLDNLGEAVAVYGGDGRLKLSNPAFGRLWNLYPEDLDGEPHITKIVDKLKPFFTDQEWPVRKDELSSKALDRLLHEGRHNRADGSLIDYSTVPLPDGGVLITYSDVTDTVNVETALREKNKALEAAEKLKAEFIANVSYQLRTPLNAIMGFNEILDQEYFGPLNERQKEYTKDTRQASERLLGLINDILDLSSIEAGNLMLEKEDIKIYDLMQDLKTVMEDWARSEQLEFSIKCPKNIGTLHADPRRLKQALVNVIRNAIAFTPEGGTIVLSAKKQNDHIVFESTDTGVGIAEEDHNTIFKPFERATIKTPNAPTDANARGAGLGLSLVKNIIDLHDGHLELESERGKGTSLKMKLPINTQKMEKAA
jgi:signal transduction histidine kinase